MPPAMRRKSCLLYTSIVSRRELNTLKTIVRERDPHAIVTVADVTEAFGEGFKDISA